MAGRKGQVVRKPRRNPAAGLAVKKKGGTWAVFDGEHVVSGGYANRDRAMTRLEAIAEARRYRTRPCLTCGQSFKSEGAHNRMCNGCRAAAGNDIQMVW